jgi:hypothetical protein
MVLKVNAVFFKHDKLKNKCFQHKVSTEKIVV